MGAELHSRGKSCLPGAPHRPSCNPESLSLQNTAVRLTEQLAAEPGCDADSRAAARRMHAPVVTNAAMCAFNAAGPAVRVRPGHPVHLPLSPQPRCTHVSPLASTFPSCFHRTCCSSPTWASPSTPGTSSSACDADATAAAAIGNAAPFAAAVAAAPLLLRR